MITLDYSPFANIKDKYFSSINETLRYEKARFERAIFDEVHMIESIDTVCTPDKKEWDYDTVFLWKGDSLEAGNIGLSGLPINQLMIKRRKKDDFVFENIKAFNFDIDTKFYEFKDRFVESYEDYVYGIQPMGGSIENPVLGETTTGEVDVEFESVWIVGEGVQYKLMYNLEVGDYETIMPSSTIETLGSMYPIVSKNGNVRYKKGSIKCMILSDTTVKIGKISPKDEKKIRKSLIAFLTDGKPKYFKDGSGETMLISIINAPILSPRNELNQLVYEISIDFVEVGSTDIQNLINLGLLKGVY